MYSCMEVFIIVERFIWKYLKGLKKFMAKMKCCSKMVYFIGFASSYGFWKEMLKEQKHMDNSWSRADPCLCYNWSHNGLTVWLSCIDGNLLLQNKNDVEVQCKKMLKNMIAEKKVRWNDMLDAKWFEIKQRGHWWGQNQCLYTVLKMNPKYQEVLIYSYEVWPKEQTDIRRTYKIFLRHK